MVVKITFIKLKSHQFLYNSVQHNCTECRLINQKWSSNGLTIGKFWNLNEEVWKIW